jgi:hypothetical protein
VQPRISPLSFSRARQGSWFPTLAIEEIARMGHPGVVVERAEGVVGFVVSQVPTPGPWGTQVRGGTCRGPGGVRGLPGPNSGDPSTALRAGSGAPRFVVERAES